MSQPKRKHLLNRRRAAIHRIAIVFAVILLINHIMHIGLLFPIQAIWNLEERAGISHTRVVERSWVPEIHKTHIAYLTENDEATMFGSCRLTIYGWMTYFGTALDCTEDASLYAGRSYMHKEGAKVWYFFGRVDNPEIERVEISIQKNIIDEMSLAVGREEVRRITKVELEQQSGRRYFLVKDSGEWDDEIDLVPRPVVIGYDKEGHEVIRVEVENGNSSSFG